MGGYPLGAIKIDDFYIEVNWKSIIWGIVLKNINDQQGWFLVFIRFQLKYSIRKPVENKGS